ncbi:ZIP family metal transporter [Candidatus Micrarchaeota archaeon]|nr:ZIP family metal transporter [Candidatus Micrarchaeota archaeon]
MVLEWIIAATVAVSLVSLVGTLAFSLFPRKVDTLLFVSVSFATGALLSAAFFDVLPESFAGLEPSAALPVVLAGILTFFVFEKFFWHHHHESHHPKQGHRHGHAEKEKPLGYLTLLGSLTHNFFDGVAIAAAFLTSVPLGLATTLAIALHEIPHELGDFGLLLYSGFSKWRATLLNLATGLTSVIGGITFFYFAPHVSQLEAYALAFTGGTFIYIAAADLVPELHKEHKLRRSLAQLAFVALGIGIIWFVSATLEHGG